MFVNRYTSQPSPTNCEAEPFRTATFMADRALAFTRAGLAREQFSPMPIPASALRKIIPCSVPDPRHVECHQGKLAAVNCFCGAVRGAV